AAVAASDVARLRRVAHGLKAVLELIGQPALAAQARALEDSAAAWAPARPCPGAGPRWPKAWRRCAAIRPPERAPVLAYRRRGPAFRPLTV
ncbi:hypothetical protein AAER12_14430, partial [Pseudomonas aeruginosa]